MRWMKCEQIRYVLSPRHLAWLAGLTNKREGDATAGQTLSVQTKNGRVYNYRLSES